MITDKIIEIKNLTHNYQKNHPSIENITFSVSKGEFIVIAGKNGSGKTTLFKLLNGLLTATSGEVFIHGKSVAKNSIFARKNLGLVFQDPDTQIVGETVFDDAAFGPENLRLPRNEIKKRVVLILKKLGLFHLKDRNPATLSGGEKRRLAIAGILSMNTEILVLDEPFSNLDFSGTLELLSYIKLLSNSGHTILIATHELEKIIFHATRLIIMDKGKIIGDDKPLKLIKKVEKFGIKEPCSSKFGMGIKKWEG